MEKRQRKAWLLDMENIGIDWSWFLPDVGKRDLVFLFYSDATARVSVEAVETFQEKKAETEFVRCVTGSGSAMDFQLVLKLGQLAGKYGTAVEYRIVSNDKDYDPVIRYLSDRGYTVGLVERPVVAKRTKAGEDPKKDRKEKRKAELLAEYEAACLAIGLPKPMAAKCAAAMYRSFSHKNRRIGRLDEWMSVHLDKDQRTAVRSQALILCAHRHIP